MTNRPSLRQLGERVDDLTNHLDGLVAPQVAELIKGARGTHHRLQILEAEREGLELRLDQQAAELDEIRAALAKVIGALASLNA